MVSTTPSPFLSAFPMTTSHDIDAVPAVKEVHFLLTMYAVPWRTAGCTVSRATTEGRRAEREAGRAPELDDFRHDEAAAYTARQSKWWRDVLQAIRCEAWWVTVCLLPTYAYLTTYLPTYPPTTTHLPTYLPT